MSFNVDDQNLINKDGSPYLSEHKPKQVGYDIDIDQVIDAVDQDLREHLLSLNEKTVTIIPKKYLSNNTLNSNLNLTQISTINIEIVQEKYYYNLFYSSLSGYIFCLLMLSFGCGK